ncbi:MAG: GntR family transcriptional regulator [Gemmataceae bacterium]
MALLATSPLSRSSLADSVYQRVLEAILSGALGPGAELSEVALAAELGVSRTPVHLALKHLVLDGLAEPMTNRQARVVQLGPAQIREIYEMRLLLEPAAAERAARRMPPEEREALRESAQVLAALKESASWPARAIEFDIRFHDALAAACGNERLRAEITKYRRLVRAFCRSSGSQENLTHAYQEHLEILAALEAQDGPRARQAMTAHIEKRMHAVLAMHEEENG